MVSIATGLVSVTSRATMAVLVIGGVVRREIISSQYETMVDLTYFCLPSLQGSCSGVPGKHWVLLPFALVFPFSFCWDIDLCGLMLY